MARRFLLLAGLCLLLGVATSAFGADMRQAPWITREGAVAMLVASKPEWRAEVEQVSANMPPMPIFRDTDIGEWYAPYLEVAFAHQLIAASDFHRDFRPGALLKQGEAIALAVRYKANGNRALIPQEEPDHPLATALHVQKGYDMGLHFPEPFELWNVIGREAWFDLIASAGVHTPSAITVTIPSPATVVPLPQQPLPVAGPIVVPSNPPAQTGYKPSPSAALAPSQPVYVPAPVAAPAVSVPPSTIQPSAPTSAFTITIPSLNIQHLTVTHPSDVTSQSGLLAPLKNGVGHLFSYPGHGGTVMVYGHSSSYAWDVSEYTKIFRQINKLNPGDRVIITYGGETFTYEVTHKQTVDASDMSAYQNTGSEQLILYTCWPPDDIKQRYLVHARPV